jgi:molybdopterin/thiamine biosynthesis adenylyltransferase
MYIPMNDSQLFNRQLDLVKPQELDFPIAIIGAGGIGSWAALALTKMGCRDLTVYDFDKVEIENAPSQFYKPSQVGMYKVDALRNNIRDMVDVDILGITEKWQDMMKGDPIIKDQIIISAVDSMQERYDIWNMFMAKGMVQQMKTPYYIDARMGGEFLNVNIVNFKDINSPGYYSKTLFPQAKSEPEVCTAKSIVYNTFFCGGLIASVVKKIAKGQKIRNDISFDIVNLSAD